MKPAAARNSSHFTGISPKTLSKASRWASASLEGNHSRASVQHKRMAAGRHTSIFRSSSMCLSWGPIFRVSPTLRNVRYGPASRLIQMCCSEFRPIDFQRKSRRYLHDNVNRYAERLTELLPDPLRVCFFVNSGSEANELALRLARTHTAKEDVIVLEHAYHGHTSTLIDISPYKFNGPGGSGKKPWVHVAPLADDFRGRYRREDKQAGAKYARDVEEILERARAEGRGVAAYIAETLPSVGGQIVFPPDYLAEVYRHLRRADAVCIADEVQVGFGRLGTHFWGFETQGVVPDIVVLGKPIGNAFPLAAV